MAGVIDGEQHDTAIVGACGARCGDRTFGRGIQRAAPVDLAPERIEIGHRRTVDAREPGAGPAVVADQRIGRAMDVDDRHRTRGLTGSSCVPETTPIAAKMLVLQASV